MKSFLSSSPLVLIMLLSLSGTAQATYGESLAIQVSGDPLKVELEWVGGGVGGETVIHRSAPLSLEKLFAGTDHEIDMQMKVGKLSYSNGMRPLLRKIAAFQLLDLLREMSNCPHDVKDGSNVSRCWGPEPLRMMTLMQYLNFKETSSGNSKTDYKPLNAFAAGGEIKRTFDSETHKLSRIRFSSTILSSVGIGKIECTQVTKEDNYAYAGSYPYTCSFEVLPN